jgi:hypothetical protein
MPTDGETRFQKGPVYTARDGTQYPRIVRNGRPVWDVGGGAWLPAIRENLPGGGFYLVVPAPEPDYGVENLEGAVELLKTVVEHSDRAFYLSLIVAAAQDWIIEWLESVFYFILEGGTGTGKSTAVRGAMALTQDGVILSSGSAPYLRDKMKDGRSVGILELALLVKENAQVLSILRNGNQRGNSTVGLKVNYGKGSGWVNVDVETFGFKAMDYNDRLDAHVLNRALRWEMSTSQNLDVAMNAEHMPERLAPIRSWLRYRKEAAVSKGWTMAKVHATWDSRAFRDRVRAFKNAWGRHGVMAADMLLVSDVLELGLEDEIRKLMDEREPELSDEAQEVREALLDLDLVNTWDKESQVPVALVLAKVNENRDAAKLPRRTSITGALRDLGFSTKRQDWVTSSKNRSGDFRGKAVLLPFEKVRSWLPDEDRANQANRATKDRESGTLGTDGTFPSANKEPGGEHVYSEDIGPVNPDPRKDAALKKVLEDALRGDGA